MKTAKLFLVIVLSIALASTATAARLSGSIKGKVTDILGYPLASAFVYVDSPTLLAIQTYITDDTGKIIFKNLPPGEFKITVEIPGFKTTSIENIIVSIGQTLNFHIIMETSSVEEEITLTIPSPALNTQSSKTSFTFESNILKHIPFTRDLHSIISSAPGIIQDFNFNSQQSLYHGSTARVNLYTLDGTNFGDPVEMSPLTSINFDAIEEIEFVSSGHSAEVSTMDGGYINILSQSGKNGFTGNINLYYTYDKLTDKLRTESELQEMGVSPPSYDKKYLDLSLTLGGSILEDRIWFFSNARLISQSRTSPFILWTDPQGTEHKEYNWSNKEKMGVVKLSSRFNPQFKISATFNLIDLYQPRSSFSLDWNLTQEASRVLDHEKNYFGSAVLNYTFNQNTFADFRAGYVRSNRPLLLQEQSWANPQYFDDSSGHIWGSARFNEIQQRKRFQVGADITHFQNVFMGMSHELKAGAEYEFTFGEWNIWKLDNLIVHYNNQNPYFFGLAESPVSGDSVGKGKISFYNTSILQNGFIPRNEIRRLGIFISDAATITERLTLNLGLRFDRTYSSQLAHLKSVSGSPIAFKIGEELIEPLIAMNPFGEFSIPTWKNVIIWNGLSPRLGLNFDIFGNGKGIFKATFSRYPENLMLQYLSALNPFSPEKRLSFYWFDENRDGLVGTDDAYALFPDDYRLYLEEFYKKRIASGTHPPYTNEITLGIQQEIFRDFSVSLNYIHKNKKDIFENVLYSPDLEREWYTYSQDTENWWIPFNTTVPGIDNYPSKEVTLYFISTENAPSLFDRFTNVPELKRKYQAFEISFKKRMSDNWQLSGSAVFSRSQGNINLGASASSGFSSAADSPNDFVNFPENSRLDFDRPVVIKLMGTYKFPLDFHLSFYFSHMSGMPWARSVTVVPPSDWLEKENALGSYVKVLLEKPGTRRLEAYKNLDVRIEKTFKVSRSKELRFFVDIFNALGNKYKNIALNDGGYWFPVDENVTEGIRTLSPNYNKVTSLYPGRIFKLSLSLNF